MHVLDYTLDKLTIMERITVKSRNVYLQYSHSPLINRSVMLCWMFQLDAALDQR